MSSKPLIDKLKDRILETQQAGLILPRHSSTLIQELDDERLEFRVPSYITARVVQRDDEEYAFDLLRCSECGNMYTFRDAAREYFRCKKCRTKPYLSQAPVFVANFRNRPPVPLPLSEAVRQVTEDWNATHCIYKKQPLPDGSRLPHNFIKGLKEADSKRPVASLCWTCPLPPNIPCEYRDSRGFCKYSRYDDPKYQSWRNDLWAGSGRINLVYPPTKRKSAFGTYVDRYRPITVSEGVTKPIRVAIHSYGTADAEQVQFNKDELPGIEEILYVRKLSIFQFTIALAVGLPYISIRRRAVRLFSNMNHDGTENYFVLARNLITEGILIKLKMDVVERILGSWVPGRSDVDKTTLAATLYHTVSHAFLKPIPIMSGLDVAQFGESFSSTDNEVAIYDNSPGGIGGVRTLFEETSSGVKLRSDYSAHLLNSLSCQLDCSWSCKACLHTGTCGWLNRQLKREKLEEIVDEHLRDRYFSV